MRKRILAYVFLILAVIAIVAFFPVANSDSISGEGVVLTMDKEKIGACNLAIEIHELKSLAAIYRKTFSFVLDDNHLSDVSSSYYSETGDGLCSISQMYYDEHENAMNACTLLYQKDLSYASIYWNNKLYFISNGTEMSYSEIPWALGTDG